VLDTKNFGDILSGYGFNFYSGVPCSFLKYLINYAINDRQFLMACDEGNAVAICAGAHLGGCKSVLLCQNSGLANTVSPLTSLNYIFKIPLLGFVSLRGEIGLIDEPQHELMGQITTDLLDMMRIKWEYLSLDEADVEKQLSRANEFIENNQSFFFVVKKGTFAPVELKPQKIECVKNKVRLPKSKEVTLPKRLQVLEKLTQLKDKNTVLLATTGFTGRELYEVKDDEQNFYMVGSMGCVSSIALGLCLAQPNKDVIAIEGDGAFLMRMGSITTNAYHGPPNMLHVLLDNNAHESTGGQATVSSCVDFVGLAANVAYERSVYIHDLDEFEQEIKKWKKDRALTFLYFRITQGKKENLGRPAIEPYQVKERLMKFLERD